jgi:hypothetical protein
MEEMMGRENELVCFAGAFLPSQGLHGVVQVVYRLCLYLCQHEEGSGEGRETKRTQASRCSRLACEGK